MSTAMNKNWNDRADKDLFFTILSVKNIGIITGAEWTIIGNHIRSLGYGFTNEGCRQHFQGLRRAQNKVEAPPAIIPPDSPKNTDPKVNPITRRPGPGRGRPRKQPPAPIAGLHPDPTGQLQLPQNPLPEQPLHDPQQQQTPASQPAQSGEPQSGEPQSAQSEGQCQSHLPPIQQTPVPVPVIPAPAAAAAASAPPPPQVGIQGELKFERRQSEGLGREEGAEEEEEEDDDDDDDDDRQVAKRPRLHSEPEESVSHQIDETVVLALAGHPTPEVGSYGANDFEYGEA